MTAAISSDKLTDLSIIWFAAVYSLHEAHLTAAPNLDDYLTPAVLPIPSKMNEGHPTFR